MNLSFKAAADRPTGKIALTGGRIVTMRDAEKTREVIENGVVVINGSRIEAVGPASKVTPPWWRTPAKTPFFWVAPVFGSATT